MRCLLLDDNDRFLVAGRARLETGAASVVAVRTLEEAVVAIETEAFDVALIDIQLEGISGFAAAERIHAQSVDLPIVMISARDPEDYRELLRDAPVVGFISKPGLSVERIRQVVQGTPPQYDPGDQFASR